MSPDIFRMVVAIIIAAHGIGHVMGVMSPLGIEIAGASGESWAFSRFGSGLTGAFEVVLFLIPTIGFVVAAIGLWTGADWFRAVAIGSALISLIAIGLYPSQLPTFSMLGAVAVDVILLAAILVFQWPATETIGA
jgi:hypothetical protein